MGGLDLGSFELSVKHLLVCLNKCAGMQADVQPTTGEYNPTVLLVASLLVSISFYGHKRFFLGRPYSISSLSLGACVDDVTCNLFSSSSSSSSVIPWFLGIPHSPNHYEMKPSQLLTNGRQVDLLAE